MLKNWTNRDWVWLLGFLIFIIMLLLANYYLEWETNLSIIANATSIALAVIAIFLSLKQDSDSKIISDSMQKDIQSLHKEFLRKQYGYNKMLDEVEDAVDSSVEVANENSGERTFTYQELVEYGEKIKKETFENYRAELNNRLAEEFNMSSAIVGYDNPSTIIKMNKNGIRKFWGKRNEEINQIVIENRESSIGEIDEILKSQGHYVPKRIIAEILNEFKK